MVTEFICDNLISGEVLTKNKNYKTKSKTNKVYKRNGRQILHSF